MAHRAVFEPPVWQLFRPAGPEVASAYDDIAPFSFHELGGKRPALIICDHATNALPAALGDLGLDRAELVRHIAWDIGAAEVTRELARRLAAPAVLSGFSRLVIDPNRRLSSRGSIPEESDGVAIPGNLALSPRARELRVERLFKPYHAAVARMIEAGIARAAGETGGGPALIFLHSFTPVMRGVERPWQVGVLWDHDRRLVEPLIEALSARGLKVGDNEPYSGRSTEDYSLHAHGETRGLPSVLLEIRQDLIDRPAGALEWARILTEVLGPILANPAVFRPADFLLEV